MCIRDSPRTVRQTSSRYLSGWMWDPLVISLFLLTSSRAERSSSARAVVAPFRRSPSSGHQTSIPRAGTFLGTSSTFPNPSPASPRKESPNHRPSPLEVLEALLHRRSASPVVLHSNRPREWIRGEFLVLPSLFPLLLCAAGAGERPPPPPPRLLPPVGRC